MNKRYAEVDDYGVLRLSLWLTLECCHLMIIEYNDALLPDRSPRKVRLLIETSQSFDYRHFIIAQEIKTTESDQGRSFS